MFDRHNPYLASLKKIYKLNKEGAAKETYHVILHALLDYKVGDSVAVMPTHDPELVLKTLKSLKINGLEKIVDKKTKISRTLIEHLSSYANITKLHASLVEEVKNKTVNEEKKKWLEELINRAERESLNAYMHSYEVWDFLQEHADCSFSAQEIADILPPLLPRFYSIASSKNYCKDEIHLTVAITDYISRGIQRNGVGTHYLCRMIKEGQCNVPIYIQDSSGFTLPEGEPPIIMIGPGTGVAPFRAFVQERMARKSKGLSWLFFGERNEKTDYFYEEFWKEAQNSSNFRISTAFSRDQAHKIYVQDRLHENAKEIFSLMQGGAYVFVCGDAHRMAKDVEISLLHIIQNEGGFSEEEARSYLKNLRKIKRYLRDVY
jgi:sulfite reductase (NADPH) flavoprotein alpha-component